MIPLQRNWQDGPASIEVEADEITLDAGKIGTGVLIEVVTTLAVEAAEADLGVLHVDLPETKVDARLTVCASVEQARALRDALSEIVDNEGAA